MTSTMPHADVLSATLREALSTGGDFAEVFVEDKQSFRACFDDGKVEELLSGRRRGAGIRVRSGTSMGFAHTADLTPAGLRVAAAQAAASARAGGSRSDASRLSRNRVRAPNEVAVPPDAVEKARKVELLEAADEAARAEGDGVSQVACTYGDSRRSILVANSDGLLTTDEQVKTLFAVSVVAVGDTGMQTGRESVGRTVGFELFDTADVGDLARTAARRALGKLAARPAPTGEIPVVIGPGGGGVLFHEACGHGLEADLIAKGASTFAGRIGEQVANPTVTLIDDGTMATEWGCYAIDDEGRPAQRNVLISNGELVDYMWDRERSVREGRAASSGNGRRESYAHEPMVRMTNTYIANGDSHPGDILADTPDGVYVAKLGGGQVNTATGEFVFGMEEAFLIEDGCLTAPIRDGNISGNGPKVLMMIDALGNDFAMGSPGTCGKDGQGVPVGDGTPTLRVRSLTVGGTAV